MVAETILDTLEAVELTLESLYFGLVRYFIHHDVEEIGVRMEGANHVGENVIILTKLVVVFEAGLFLISGKLSITVTETH